MTSLAWYVEAMRYPMIAVLVAACGPGRPPANVPGPGSDPIAEPRPLDPPPAPSKPVTNRSLAAIGLDPVALDRRADPCDDFYQFACGGWIARTEIDADKPVAMRSFVDIEERNLVYLRGVLEAAAKQPGTDPIAKQLGAYFGACMDETAIEAAGTQAIAPMRATIATVIDARTLAGAIAQLRTTGFNMLFTLGPTQDSADARNVIAEIDQGGLGLPDRDFYLNDDATSKKLRAQYAAYVAAMLAQLGARPDGAKRDADKILTLEIEIAMVSKDKVARRDPKGTYNRLDKAGVAKAMPHFDWPGYWKTVGLDKIDGVTVSSPEFLAGIDALIAKTSADTWRAYLTFHVGNKSAGYLAKAIEQTKFKFYSELTGQPEQPPRWKRCVEATDEALGDLLGQVFVRDRFAGTSKAAAEAQVQAIAAEMKHNLAALPWMDADTKRRAAEKLGAMTYQIGYPKAWRTYRFKIEPKLYGANAIAANKAETTRRLAKIGKPVDRDDWAFSAPTVNAFYNPQLNNMLFPAGILQPPFYSVASSIPVNLGAMGMVVGHELTHGFDDQGSQFDAVGNLVNWWQPDTAKQFTSRTQCVVDQYAQYEAAGSKVDGRNTLGENIADGGGVKLALAAARKLRATAPDTIVADGFTEDQQFFLSFGQVWCAKLRPEYEKLLVTVDVHSPAKWRVNGTVSANPEFASAFRCKAGAKMAPAKQCVVW